MRAIRPARDCGWTAAELLAVTYDSRRVTPDLPSNEAGFYIDVVVRDSDYDLLDCLGPFAPSEITPGDPDGYDSRDGADDWLAPDESVFRDALDADGYAGVEITEMEFPF